jgi:5'-nucleotidase
MKTSFGKMILGTIGSKLRLAVTALVVMVTAGSLVTASAAARPAAGPATSAATDPLRILVTNDDGVAAPGIARLVDVLQGIPNSEITVIAPAANQSGTGPNFTSTPITVAPATTASGDAATAVSGFPADTVLYGVLTAMPVEPDIVVSGINFGQNLGNITEVSGTVGAARTANRLGIPAIAVSQGFAATVNYTTAALSVRIWIELFREEFESGTLTPKTLNINVPSCASGSIRGLLAVPLGRNTDVGGYTLQSGSIGNGTFAPTIVSKNPVAASNCESTATNFDNDIDAFNNGYITITGLNQDLGDR